MTQIDERVVSMAFDNAKFEANVAVTMKTLSDLDARLNAVGKTSGLSNIEKDAQKVTLQAPMSALDRLKARLTGAGKGSEHFADIENAANKVTLNQPMSRLDRLKAKLFRSSDGSEKLQDIEKAGQKVTLDAPVKGLDRLKARLGLLGRDSGSGFRQIEQSSRQVSLQAPIRATDQVKNKLTQLSAGGTFSKIEQSSNAVKLNGINQAVQVVTRQFSVLQGAASVALGSIAAQAAGAAAQFAKGFTLGPVIQGFQEYSTNLSSIQTILANTQADGTNLQQVNAALAELNHYSDQTIYNFSEMARNIGTFTAAGVKLDTATSSIKGIANLAALSGSNSQQASTAMYQLSQAIAAGKVNLQDWNSVVNAGMGGKVFQKALFDTAKQMGTLTNVPMGQTFDEWTKAGNSFRQSLSATQKQAKGGTDELKKAQKDAAEQVANAEEAAAESVSNAKEQVNSARENVAKTAKQSADNIAKANDQVKNAEEGVRDASLQSAEAIKNAKEQVKEAQTGVAETAKNGSDAVKAATKAQADAIKQSAQDVKDALEGVREARQRLAEAMKPPSQDELEAASDNLRTAQLDQADLAGAVTDAQQEQQRSAEDLAAAQKKLAEAKRDKAPAEDINAAQRAVEDAQKRVQDAADAQERALLQQRAATRGVTEAAKELSDVQKKGTKDDENVKAAKDDITAALDRVKAAQKAARDTELASEKQVTEARKNRVKANKAAAAQLVAAEEQVTQARKDGAKNQEAANKQLIDAEKQLTEARQNGAESQRQAQKQLDDAEKNEVKTTKDAQKQIADAHEAAAERITQTKQKLSGDADKGPMTWLTSDVLTSTLQQFTGDLTDAQLKAKGFSDEQIKAIQAQAKTAKNAATQVKTISQVVDVAKETIGSGWAKTFQLLFGNFNQSKKTFTSLSNAINDFINKGANARNKLLTEFNKLGGRNKLIEFFKTAFKDLGLLIKPISQGFRDIFPKQTPKGLISMVDNMQKFADTVGQFLKDNGPQLRSTFRGFFSILDIGKQAITAVVKGVVSLFGATNKASGGFLNITAKIGDFFYAIDQAIKRGDLFDQAIKGIVTTLKGVIGLLKAVAGYVVNLFTGGDTESGQKVADQAERIHKALGPLAKVLDAGGKAFDAFMNALGDVKEFFQPLVDQITTGVGGLAKAIADAFKNGDSGQILDALKTGFLGGIFLYIRNFFKRGLRVNVSGLQSINGVLDALTGRLQAMQSNIKADTLFKIAAAIGLLSISLGLLSVIDGDKLAKALTAVGIAMGTLLSSVALIGKMSVSIKTLPIVAFSLIAIAGAVDLLSIAVYAFSRLSWEEIAKGLASVAGVLGAVSLAAKGVGPNIIAFGAALIPIAAGLFLMAGALSAFGSLDLLTIGKGFGAMAGTLVILAAAVTKFPTKTLPFVGAGLVLVGAGLVIIAKALQSFGSINLLDLAKGLVAMASSLGIIIVALAKMPENLAARAGGLFVVSIALNAVATALKMMGGMSVGEIAKGLIALGGSLVILAGGLTLMSGTFPGAAALLAAGAAIAVLAPALGFLGTLDLLTIVKGLAALGGTLAVIAAVGVVVAPALTAIGSALIPIGASIALIAGGFYLFAQGLSILGANGTKALAVLTAGIVAFVAEIPKIAIEFVKGLLEVLKKIAELGPQIVTALGEIVSNVVTFIINNAPKFALAAGALIGAFLKVLVDNGPNIINAGLKLLVDLLTGISNNIGKITTTVATIIVRFLAALEDKLPEIIDQGARTLVKFLDGLATKIPELVAAGGNVVIKFLNAIAQKIPGVVSAGGNIIIKFLNGIANKIPDVITAGTNIILKVLKGIEDNIPKIRRKAVHVAGVFLDNLGKGLVGLADKGAQAIIDFLNGVAKSIRENERDIIKAGFNIGDAIVDGMKDGIKEGAPGPVKGLLGIANKGIKVFKKVNLIFSPSRVYYGFGQNIVQGLTDGIDDSAPSSVRSTVALSAGMSDAFEDNLDVEDPVITPVLDLSKLDPNGEYAGVLEKWNRMSQLETDIPKFQAKLEEYKNAGFDITSGQNQISKMQAELDALKSLTTVDEVRARAIATTVAGLVAPSVAVGGGGYTRGGTAPVTEINVEQNNYSPEALSPIDTYRNTKNAVALARNALGKAAA